MRFFQHQTKAQAQTRRLLGLFALTVLGLVLAMNGALALTWWGVRWALNGMVCGLEMVFNLGQTLCAPDDDGRRSAWALPGFAVMATGSLGWLATHPPLSERIRRVYGRPMPPLRRQRDDSAGSRPAGLFQEQ